MPLIRSPVDNGHDDGDAVEHSRGRYGLKCVISRSKCCAVRPQIISRKFRFHTRENLQFKVSRISDTRPRTVAVNFKTRLLDTVHRSCCYCCCSRRANVAIEFDRSAAGWLFSHTERKIHPLPPRSPFGMTTLTELNWMWDAAAATKLHFFRLYE